MLHKINSSISHSFRLSLCLVLMGLGWDWEAAGIIFAKTKLLCSWDFHHLVVNLEATGSRHVSWTFWYWNTECENHFTKSEVLILALMNLLWLWWSYDLALNLSFSICAMGGEGGWNRWCQGSLSPDFHESLVSPRPHNKSAAELGLESRTAFLWFGALMIITFTAHGGSKQCLCIPQPFNN